MRHGATSSAFAATAAWMASRHPGENLLSSRDAGRTLRRSEPFARHHAAPRADVRLRDRRDQKAF